MQENPHQGELLGPISQHHEAEKRLQSTVFPCGLLVPVSKSEH